MIDRYFIFLQHRRAYNLQTNIYTIPQTSDKNINTRRKRKRTREILSKLFLSRYRAYQPNRACLSNIPCATSYIRHITELNLVSMKPTI